MPIAIEMITTKAPKSGSLEQQDADRDHCPSHRQKCFLQVVHMRHLAHRVVGVEHGEQFHQFGGLQVGDTHRQPTARAIDVTANAGISTSASRTKPATNSHGDSFCHVASGTWKASPAAIKPMARKTPGRTRK